MRISHFLAITILSATSLPVLAQAESTDSVAATDLEEVVVEGVTRRIIKFGAEYTPAKKVKKAALDATRLLQIMQLPQLNVSAVSGDVKTIAGKEVSMFVDYRPASKDELEGMRTDDVMRVEVLDFPDDPRFNGAEHVVNFIMRKYEWGGYTKLTLTGHTLGQDDIFGHIYSKFSRGKWLFDLSARGGGAHNDKLGSSSDETFRDVTFQDTHYPEITRRSESGDNNLRRNNSQNLTLRATYNTGHIFMRHSASFGRNRTPYERMKSAVTFNPEIVEPTFSSDISDWLSFSAGARGYYQFTLPKSNTLNVSWDFNYGSTKRHSRYTLGELDPIVNNNREKVYNPVAHISYSKRFSHNNTFRTALMSYNSIYDTRYLGTNPDRQKLLSSENMLFLEYMQNWNFGLSLYTRVGMSYVVGRVNGTTTLKQWNPRLGFQLQWQINSHHSASVDGWWGNSHPQPSTSSTALVRSNELMWLQGNPDLRNTIFNQIGAGYNYIPNNLLSFSAHIEYERNGSKQAYEYFSLPGHDGLIRRSINSGTGHRIEANIGANATLFKNSLVLGAGGTFHRAILTGADATAASWFTGYCNATAMIRNFTIILFYSTPSRQLDAWTNGHTYRYKSSYGINLIYGTGDFKGQIGFYNWFNGNADIRSSFASPRYSISSREWSSQLTRSLYLSLTYTIPYGKAISHRDEITGQQKGSNSAILR